MWLMLQQDTPDDYVLATGETQVRRPRLLRVYSLPPTLGDAHRDLQSVRLFVEKAFSVVGTTNKWVGHGVDEKGVDAKDEKRVLVAVDPAYFRPTEVRRAVYDCALRLRRKCGSCAGRPAAG
jgi:GDPmannose 4,6-dehydratase